MGTSLHCGGVPQQAHREGDLGAGELGVPGWERQHRGARLGRGLALGVGREISIKPEMSFKF